jgi:exoribonuclease R
MLPPALTMMASLLPGTDKLAVSVILEITQDGIVINRTFYQSIIHSCAQLHYSHAQVLIFNLLIFHQQISIYI